jgi:hypothetical protein
VARRSGDAACFMWRQWELLSTFQESNEGNIVVYVDNLHVQRITIIDL